MVEDHTEKNTKYSICNKTIIIPEVLLPGCRKRGTLGASANCSVVWSVYNSVATPSSWSVFFIPLALFFFVLPACSILIGTTKRCSVDDNACQILRNLSQHVTWNAERNADLTRGVAKSNVILNNWNQNDEGSRTNTEKHRIGGQQSADGNLNTEGLKINTEKRSIRWQ